MDECDERVVESGKVGKLIEFTGEKFKKAETFSQINLQIYLLETFMKQPSANPSAFVSTFEPRKLPKLSKLSATQSVRKQFSTS